MGPPPQRVGSGGPPKGRLPPTGGNARTTPGANAPKAGSSKEAPVKAVVVPENPLRRVDTIRVSLRKEGACTASRSDVYKILFQSNVDIRHVYSTATGFSVIADNPSEVEKLISSSMVTKLAEIKLKPLPPPELLARRTVVVRGVDELVGSHSAESIKEEISRNDSGVMVKSVIKIPNRPKFF